MLKSAINAIHYNFNNNNNNNAYLTACYEAETVLQTIRCPSKSNLAKQESAVLIFEIQITEVLTLHIDFNYFPPKLF